REERGKRGPPRGDAGGGCPPPMLSAAPRTPLFMSGVLLFHPSCLSATGCGRETAGEGGRRSNSRSRGEVSTPKSRRSSRSRQQETAAPTPNDAAIAAAQASRLRMSAHP